jgi:hypothetical protein
MMEGVQFLFENEIHRDFTWMDRNIKTKKMIDLKELATLKSR